MIAEAIKSIMKEVLTMEMVYTAKSGEKIVFDWFSEFSDDSGDPVAFWAEICPACREKYKHILTGKYESGCACGSCSVMGCSNESDSYVDFALDEVDVYGGYED